MQQKGYTTNSLQSRESKRKIKKREMKQGLPIADSYTTGIKTQQSELHIQNVWTEKGYTDKLNTKFYYFVFFVQVREN